MILKLKFILIIVFNSFFLFSQDNETYFLKWNLKDSIIYDVDLGAVKAETTATYNSDQDIDANLKSNIEKKMELYVDSIIDHISSYNLNLKVIAESNSLNPQLLFNNKVVFSAKTNLNGVFISSVEKQQENLSEFFLKVPNDGIKVGDSWKSNMNFNMNYTGDRKIISSTRLDNVKFESIKKTGKDAIAILKTTVIEKIEFEKSNDTTKPNFIQAYYTSTKEFNITSGRMEKVKGVIILSTDQKNKKPSTTRLSLHLKK